MMNKMILTAAAPIMLAAGAQASLTTAEVVAKAKPCIVSIRMSNSAHPEAGSSLGTGFFIAKDRIITAFHVGAGNWDHISVVDLSNNVIHVAPDPTYANGSKEVDLLILKVIDEIDHPYLSFAFNPPVEGQNVIVVGNPQGFSGTVSTASSQPSALMETYFSLLPLSVMEAAVVRS